MSSSVKNDKAMHYFRKQVERTWANLDDSLTVAGQFVWTMRCLLANGLAVPPPDVEDPTLVEYISDTLDKELKDNNLMVVIEKVKGHRTLRFLPKS